MEATIPAQKRKKLVFPDATLLPLKMRQHLICFPLTSDWLLKITAGGLLMREQLASGKIVVCGCHQGPPLP